MDFCDELIKNKYNIIWRCSARLDILDEEMIEKMAQSGCMGVFFGIETGSKRMQKIVNKNLNLGTLDRIMECMIKHNMGAVCSFIYGFPEETEEDLNDTLLLIYHLKKIEAKHRNKIRNFIELWPIAFLPGTQMGEAYKEQLVFNENRGFDFNNSIYKKGEEVIKLVKSHKNLFLSFYNLEKNTSFEYQCLNTFIMYLFNDCYPYMKDALDMLILYFNNSIVQMYKEIFKYCENEIGTLSLKNIEIEGKTKDEELMKFLEIIRHFLDRSNFKAKDFQLFNMLNYSINIFYDICKFHLSESRGNRVHTIENMDKAGSPILTLIKKYQQLLLPVKSGMSQSSEYKAIIKGGKKCSNDEALFKTSVKDTLYEVTTSFGEVEILYLEEREDFERFIQVMAYACEPYEIPKSAKVITLSGIINWQKLRSLSSKNIYKESGSKVEDILANKVDYVDTIIVLNKGDLWGLSHLSAGYDQLEWEQISNQVRMIYEYINLVCYKQQIDFGSNLMKEIVVDYLCLWYVMGEYNVNLAKRLVGIDTIHVLKRKKVQDIVKNYEDWILYERDANCIVMQLQVNKLVTEKYEIDDIEDLLKQVYLKFNKEKSD